MNNSMNIRALRATRELFGHLDRLGEFLPQLGLRFLLAYEFWESGVEKFHGENWFADIHERFPFPFDLVPVDISWFLATWSELGDRAGYPPVRGFADGADGRGLGERTHRQWLQCL